MASCAKVQLSEYITIGLQIEENVLLGVPKVIGWLVWMGLMSAFELWCEFLEKKQILSLFVGIFAGAMSAVSQNLCLSGLDFGDSLAQGNEELWCCQNLCLSGSGFGNSLAQGNEELWCS